MVMRAKRWVGFGPPPVVGVQFRGEAIYLALVRNRPLTVVALGVAGLAVGTVVDGQVRRPNDAATALSSLLSEAFWSEQLIVQGVVEPVGGPSRAAGVISVPVHERAGLDGEIEIGAATAAEQTVSSAAAALQAATGSNGVVEISPVAIARFLRLAQPDRQLRFVRSSSPGQRWTICDGEGRFDIEIHEQRDGPTTLVDGPSQSQMKPTEWGSIGVERTVRKRWPQPGPFTAAVGAALGRLGADPSCNLVGESGQGRELNGALSGGVGRWTMEQIR